MKLKDAYLGQWVGLNYIGKNILAQIHNIYQTRNTETDEDIDYAIIVMQDGRTGNILLSDLIGVVQ